MYPEEFTNDLKFLPFKQNLDSVFDIKPAYLNPKVVFKEYFEKLFDKLNLHHKVHIYLSYPTEVYFKQLLTPNEGLDHSYKRGLVIYLEGQKLIKYIGNVLRNDIYGWIESFNLVLMHWNLDHLDRDIMGDFILRAVLEGIESKYFLIKGIPIVNLKSHQESAEDFAAINQVLYKKRIDIEGYRFIFLKRALKGEEAEEIIRQISLTVDIID